MPSMIFVDSNTYVAKSLEVDRLFNKQTVKKGKGRIVEYLVCWARYGPKWDK